MQMRHGTGRKPRIRGFMTRFFSKWGTQPAESKFKDHSTGFMTRLRSKRGKSIPRCFALSAFLFTLLLRRTVWHSINGRYILLKREFKWDAAEEIKSYTQAPEWVQCCTSLVVRGSRLSSRNRRRKRIDLKQTTLRLTLTAPGRSQQLTPERLHSYQGRPRQHRVALQSSRHAKLSPWTPLNVTTLTNRGNWAVEIGVLSMLANSMKWSLMSSALHWTLLMLLHYTVETCWSEVTFYAPHCAIWCTWMLCYIYQMFQS